MSQDFESAASKLTNLQAIEPLLSTLKTISMGTWQTAQKRITKINKFEESYSHIINQITPHLEIKLNKRQLTPNKKTLVAETIILILGSERGLCGKFNESLAERAVDWVNAQSLASYQIWAIGKRMIRALDRMNVQLSWHKSLTRKELLSYSQSYLLTQDWLGQYEENHFNSFILLFNQMINGRNFHFSTYKLLPYEVVTPALIEKREERWPPPIIETDPKGIYRQIIHQYIASSFYQVLLRSTAAEHAARYYLLEKSEENAEDIIEDLNRIIQTERRQKITQQVQELAVGAGLLDNK